MTTSFSLLGLKRSDVSAWLCVAAYAVLFLVFRKFFEWMPMVEFRSVGSVDRETLHLFLAFGLATLSVTSNFMAMSVLYEAKVVETSVQRFLVVMIAQLALACMANYVSSDKDIIGCFWVVIVIMFACLLISEVSTRMGNDSDYDDYF